MTKVWSMTDPNRPKLDTEGGTAIYIGRPGPWGNPFIIGRHGTRAEVIQKYEDLITTQRLPLHHIELLRGHDLVCWCAPLPCHGDVLLKLANPTP